MGTFEFVFGVVECDFLDGGLAVFEASAFVSFVVTDGAAACADVDVGFRFGCRCRELRCEEKLAQEKGCGED